MRKALLNYGNKTSKAKLLALCIKAVTGVIGGTLIIEQNHPYLSLSVLCIGAISNEIINFYQWDNKE